jgi:serine/threonine protein kinase
MELGGDPIGKLLGQPRDPRWVARVGYNLAHALTALHDTGHVYRDLHGENVLIRGEDPDSVRVVDFGTTVAWNGKEVEAGSQRGRWRAPEQIGPKGMTVYVTPATDVFAVGLLMEGFLTGKNPAAVPDSRVYDFDYRLSILKELRSGAADPALRAVIDRAMQFDRGDRFQSARDLCTALWPLVS